MRPRACALVVLATLLLLPAAAAQNAAQAQGTQTLEPGGGLHLIPVTLAKGDGLAYDWKVTSPPGAVLYFSVHEHIGALQVNLTQANETALNDTFVAPRDGLYSILWINNGNDTEVLQYRSQAVQAHKPASTPFPGALLAAGMLGLAAIARRRRA